MTVGYGEGMNKYTITLKFKTDRELTENERDCLMNAVFAQIEDPHVNEGGETVRATFRVEDVEGEMPVFPERISR